MQIRRKITKPKSGKYHRKLVQAKSFEEFKAKILASPLEFHKGNATCHTTRTIYRWVQA